MDAALQAHLRTLTPREIAGPRTRRKYGFQDDYSLLCILELHKTEVDYVVLFDFQDDFVVIDLSVEPNLIDFFQIKSKDSGVWYISDFIRGTPEKQSILTKMFTNKQSYPDNTRTLNFVSNAAFKFKDLISGNDSETLSRIDATDLSDTDKSKCNAKIKAELGLADDPSFQNITIFRRTELSNKRSCEHCMGEIESFFRDLNRQNTAKSSLAYDQIKNEIERKTSEEYPDNEEIEYSVLIEKKGLTRGQFQQLIEAAGLYKSSREIWGEIETELGKSNIGFLEMRHIKAAWRDFSASELAYQKDSGFNDLNNAIDLEINIKKGLEANRNVQMYELAVQVLQDINHEGFSTDTIKCMILKKLNDA